MSDAATSATWNPAATPAAEIEAPVDPAAGGSKALAIVRSIASPTGNPTRDEVLTKPEAKPSSPGRVPATAAIFTAGNPMLAPSAQTSKPGINTKALPVGDMGVRRRVPIEISPLESKRV